MLLGIFFHSVLSYANHSPPFWVVQNEPKYVLFDFIAFILHSFRMEVFFVISGFFAYQLFKKRGILAFIKNRIQRILLPFLVFWMMTLVLLTFIPKRIHSDFQFTEIPIFHLWFLYYLLIFYAIFILIMFIINRLPNRLRFVTFPPLSVLSQIIILSLLTYFPLCCMNSTSVDTSLGFYPDLKLLLYYSIYFMVGVLFYQKPAFFESLAKNRWIYIGMAFILLLWVFPFYLKMGYTVSSIVKFTAGFLSFRFIYAILSWTLVFALIAFVFKYYQQPNKIVRYLSDSSYWMYLMHLPLIFYFQSILEKHSIPPILKPFLTFGLTFALLLFSYHFLVRHSMIGAFLTGNSKKRNEEALKMNVKGSKKNLQGA